MEDVVSGYRLDAVHTFRVRTLGSLGYRTRVALGNASFVRSEWTSSFRVDVSISDGPGKRRMVATNVARVEPGQRCVLECEDFAIDGASDRELVFHLIPERLSSLAVDGTITLPRSQLFFYLTAQDHYVEYHRADGFSAGILYQTGAFNYALFSKETSTLVQAPKCYVSNHVDTLLSLVSSSADPDWSTTATVACALVAENGALVAEWTETLPPFSVVLASLRARIEAAGVTLRDTPRFFCLHAVCTDATLLPIMINRDDRTGAIGLEHSLPPLYYAEAARGPLRGAAIAGFGGVVARARRLR